MILENIISIFIINYLRKNRELTVDFSKWEKLLNIGIGVGAGLIFFEVTHLLPNSLLVILTIILFGGVTYLSYRVPGFSKGKSLVYAILPYMIISFAGQLIEIVARQIAAIAHVIGNHFYRCGIGFSGFGGRMAAGTDAKCNRQGG